MNWYKIHKIADSEKIGIISFDFDDTLTKPEFSDEEGMWISQGPNEKWISKMRELYDEGNTIIIVTSRYDKDMEEVRHFVQEHNLPVSGIYNTNGADKAPLLEQLGVALHFDDDEREEELAKDRAYNVERVWHPLDVEMENENYRPDKREDLV